MTVSPVWRAVWILLLLVAFRVEDVMGYLSNRPLVGVKRTKTPTSWSHHRPSPIRKREIVQSCWSSAKLSVKHSVKNSMLGMKRSTKNDADDENNNAVEAKLEAIKLFLNERIPPKILQFLDELFTNLLNARMVVISFMAGVILTGALIFVPVYNQVESLSEPVTLFETILADIKSGYVDEVDTNKLFETGISAMLRSLDPYTEFEGKQEAVALTESIDGKYGGVGLVISGATPRDIAQVKKVESRSVSKQTTTPTTPGTNTKLLPQDAIQDNLQLKDGDNISNGATTTDDDEDEDGYSLQERLDEKKAIEKVRNQGIRVVSAFEGYAFDYGMRVGDRLIAIDDTQVGPDTTVEEVRNKLRGQPGTSVEVSFEREGVEGVQTVSIPRTVVKIRDVKLATLVGNPADGIGYIQLTGFAQDAGREMRNAILSLQRQAEDVTGGERSLQGLILDLRGNPGGLLTSAVDVCSLLVPKNSDIVSARGRGFPNVLYRSRVDPILDPSTKLAVLINGGTASAAEIVSGAIQDLDVGVVVGSDRSFGKGLVQNVEELPFDTALKFTVAKYYTPSGRCIQGINYKEGGGLSAGDARYTASKVAAEDRSAFYTKSGREVKDGGGIEADYKVPAPKASALEVTLLRSGVISDFASQWSRQHELTNNFQVDDDTYKEFQNFVTQKQKDGDIKLEALYAGPLSDLRKALKLSGYKGSTKELENLQATIVREVQRDFDRYSGDIKEDIAQGILARYLPESMLIERSIRTDVQVQAALKLVRNDRQFSTLLARGSSAEQQQQAFSTINAASRDADGKGALVKLNW
ncbi:tail specific protease [Fragilaria crotonensis]|nr:tail specific protease [Fragilaria crotonensis]